MSLKAGVGVSASELGWRAWWLREGDGVGASMQACEGGGGLDGNGNGVPHPKTRRLFSAMH